MRIQKPRQRSPRRFTSISWRWKRAMLSLPMDSQQYDSQNFQV